MAKTRTQIKTVVGFNTQRATEKAALVESLCDEALKVATGEHPFRDTWVLSSDLTITEGDVSTDISSLSNLLHVVSAMIVQDSGESYAPLVMKDKTWWDRNVGNAEDNQNGWPMYGFRAGDSIYYDRPCEDDLTLRVRYSKEVTFTNDATECPIAILDTFVTQYATAFLFLSIENMEKYAFWKNIALGPRWDAGEVGGTLLHAINTDKIDISEEFSAERYEAGRDGSGGIAIQNLISGHDDENNVRTWY